MEKKNPFSYRIKEHRGMRPREEKEIQSAEKDYTTLYEKK